MTTDRRMRASDQDRENAVESLRGAYAEGRLRPGEFYERIDAVYAAITWGELDSMTADLPLAWADADLPADTAVTRGRRLLTPSAWVLVIVLAASVAGRTTSAAVWAACVLVPLALLLASCCHSPRDAPERRPPRPDRDGRSGTVLYDNADYPALPTQASDPAYIAKRYSSTGGGPDSDSGRAVADMKRYTFQALVTLYDGGDVDRGATLGSAPRRMVLRGRNTESGRSQIFTALVSCDDEMPFRPGCPRLLTTLRLAGDDVTDYLSIGGHFDLLLGNTVGDGIITRRLFV